jgi:recombination protein RecT
MTGQELERRTPMQEVCDTIAGDSFRARVAPGAEAQGVSVERFIRTALMSVQTNPELITADRPSLYTSIIRASLDGLLPDGREAALVIYKTKGVAKVQYLPMIFGLRKKAAEHGFSLSAYTVHENDLFTYQLGLAPTVTHVPPPLGQDRGDVIGAYAVAKDRANGEPFIDVMDRAEIEKVRAVSRSATSEYGPWTRWFEEQAKKTVARRLYKTLPFGDSSDAGRILEAVDTDTDFGDEPKMSLEEANLHASLDATPVATDDGPDDGMEADWPEDDWHEEPEPQLTMAEMAEKAQRTRAARDTE